MTAATFPPLLTGRAVDGVTDPFAKACALAVLGCDAGLVVHNVQADRLRAAIVFAPERPLEEAMIALPVCGIGFQNALGALAPPEVAVHLTWSGGIEVNGAACGRFRAAASTRDPQAVPDWLVIGLDLPLLPVDDDAPGATPERTSLYAEGCAEVDGVALLEAWARHMLVWLNTWEDAGAARIHTEWMGLAKRVGEAVAVDGRQGTFLGVDERFGMLLRDGRDTHLIPLSSRLEEGEAA
ncbi:hypothetical protein DDZ14_09280 [Maritimibacter sp. 55A14]|uniref:biotin/lipoate--protein ligase family protein n=1 Tax=Maritimibacter sp. 55A14 TaxID=2174844 RepID=UPI000D61C765|nr:biotin/lipoate--protein ligase family protein [Maritimibacter sp. 55A14]PWE32578.1 hypothetical protein DDZ14_09280 [Maritimibacter sp. 55A14]